MDPLFDLPSEPRLSNTILKNRPLPPSRIKVKQRKNIQSPTVGLDDVVPLENSNSNQPLPIINTENEQTSVVFRDKKPFALNRNKVFPYPLQDNTNPAHSLNPSDTTLFYVTSSVFNQKFKSYSTSSDQQSLSKHDCDDVNQVDKDTSLKPMDNTLSSNSTLNEDFSTSSIITDESLTITNKTTDYLEKVRDNPSNCQCADCDSEYPTIAIMSWLLVICKKCAAVHRRLTSDFLHLQSLLSTTCDPYLIDLLHDYGNKFVNSLLENDLSKQLKPNDKSSESEREEYLRKKYIEKIYLELNHHYTQEQLDKMLYENVETSNYRKTLHLIILGANPNYSEKMFVVADHAKRHQQIKQMKIILANGGLSEFDLIKTKSDDVNEKLVYLSTKHGVLKEVLTRYENDRLKIYSLPQFTDRSFRCLFEIDLNNILAICNQSVNSVSLKCRLNNSSMINSNTQCILIVDEQNSANEYFWFFQNELERSLWIREIIKREYSYYQLIYTDFLLLMKLNIQEGINADKQQIIVIIYSGKFVICSDTIYDEIDLRKYSNLTYQKNEEFTGVILSLVSNRFLYLSSPILKLIDILYSCLSQAIKVKTITDLNKQILTSQNIPVIVERFINFIFEHGLQTKGIYRQAGQETKIRQLLNDCLNDPFTPLLTRENYTEHDVANGLKRFLRQLDIPLLGTRQNYYAWLRSTVDNTMTYEQLIQYYRALLKNLQKNFPIHYSTLRMMLIHIHTVAMLSDINGMTLSNLISTFAPCLISQGTTTSLNYEDKITAPRKMSLDDIDFKNASDNYYDNHTQQSSESNDSPRPVKLKRNQSFTSPRLSVTSTSSQFPLSPAYIHVEPSIHADLEIMSNLCKYYRELFDITDEEIEHERTCIETLLSIRNNEYIPRKLDGAMISVYFESRADELNGYAMNIVEKETTADMIIEKLLKQINKNDCFFWALFEVIIDQNLERPMYLCENISEALYRYRTYLSHELNRQATFVLKLNYIQFEKERLEQRGISFNNQTIQCEYFDLGTQRWMSCLWVFEKATLKVYRVLHNINDRNIKWKSNINQQPESFVNFTSDQHSLLYSWSVEEIYLYIGADYRFITPFDMNEYRVLTILPPEILEETHTESAFGRSFRFTDRNQMFYWYLELTHTNGYDKWLRDASRTLPDGVNYLPLQNYHTPLNIQRKKTELLRNKFLTKSCHVASNFCRQLRK